MDKISTIRLKYLFYLLLFICIQFKILYSSDDFYTALKNYENGNYRIAQIFFENYMNNNPMDTLVPDATYYLLKIYDKKEDLIKFISLTNDYLNSFRFHPGRNEIFNSLIQKLAVKKSFQLAFEYIKRYDYLPVDSTSLNNIVLNLGTEGLFIDELLRLSPYNDSLKILKASRLNDFNERIRILKEIPGIKGKLHLIENYLLMGDTVSGYIEFKKIILEEIPDDLLYTYARFSLDLNRKDLYRIFNRLKGKEKFKEKNQILSMFIMNEFSDNISIKDQTDIWLIQKFFNLHHITQERLSKPKGIESILSDTVDIENKVILFRKEHTDNFYLDSLYCEILLKKKEYAVAYEVIKSYLKFEETKNYARIIRALKLYDERKYREALKDFFLSSFNEESIKYIFAECLEYNNLNPESIYVELSKTAVDSLIKFKSFSNYVKYEFNQKKYSVILKIKPDIILFDTTLTRYYLLSLVYTGKKSIAESLYIQTFKKLDKDFYYADIQHLIENKDLITAQNLVDSLIKISEYSNDETINYYAGLIAFRRGDYKLAESRFEDFIKNFSNSEYYYSVLFKVGTIKYLNQEFDSSAYYYNLASADSELKFEALQNQIVALKKSERWKDLIETSKKTIEISPDSLKAEYYFETGYAYLRMGNTNNAIEYLKMAVNLNPLIDYHYWLGEAYLGKGDFMHALYHYQKIVNDFKRDQMWYPTALFKAGLALEMMDEIKEAKNIYKRIINEFGTGDVWAKEAQKRLEQLK